MGGFFQLLKMIDLCLRNLKACIQYCSSEQLQRLKSLWIPENRNIYNFRKNNFKKTARSKFCVDAVDHRWSCWHNHVTYVKFEMTAQTRHDRTWYDSTWCLSNPKLKHTTGESGAAAHGGAAGRSGAGQNGTPTGRFAPERNLSVPSRTSKASKTTVLNVFSEARKKQILCTYTDYWTQRAGGCPRRVSGKGGFKPNPKPFQNWGRAETWNPKGFQGRFKGECKSPF